MTTVSIPNISIVSDSDILLDNMDNIEEPEFTVRDDDKRDHHLKFPSVPSVIVEENTYIGTLKVDQCIN